MGQNLCRCFLVVVAVDPLLFNNINQWRMQATALDAKRFGWVAGWL